VNGNQPAHASTFSYDGGDLHPNRRAHYERRLSRNIAYQADGLEMVAKIPTEVSSDFSRPMLKRYRQRSALGLAILIFYAFDLLHLDGKDLRDLPLMERRRKLSELVAHSPIQFSEEFVGDAVALFRACAAHELEDIGFLLLGIDRDRKTKARRALLAKAERGQSHVCGCRVHRLRAEERIELQDKLAALAVEQPPISWLRNREARWVKPVLIRHLGFGNGLLRHATVRGLG
jgi:hypothetical protein